MSNQENLIAMNMKYGTQSVQYFYKQGKLTEEQFNEVSGVIKSLFKIINDSQKNYNSLNETMRILKKDLTSIKHQYEAANNRQAEVTQQTQKLSRALKTAEVAYQSQKASYENLLFEAQELQKEVTNMDQKMKEEFRSAEDKIQPKLDKFNLDIQENSAMNDKTKNSIQNLQKILQENMHKIQSIKKQNSELEEQEQKLKQIRLKIKDSPDHYAKSAENLNIEIIGMQNELKQLKDQIDRKEKICATFKEKMDQQKEQIEQLKAQRQEAIQNTQEIGTSIESIRNLINGKQNQRGQLKVDIMNQQQAIADVTRTIKSEAEKINNARKQIQKVKRQYKKQQVLKIQQQQIIKETELIIQKLRKQFTIITSQMREQKSKQQSVIEDTAIVHDKTENIEQKTINSQGKKKEIEAEIKKMEGNLTELKRMVNNIQKEIKDSTGVRQSMARKASTATAEVRETREELKVKQLLILDLTKKYEQTGNKLQHFKALYEEVKSARNKYVNLIQNSSQDLAQLKQRIKILQNQLEILKNQSAEKNKTIQDYNHMLQLQIHKRDQTKAKLNKYDLEKKEKKEMVDQNTNEIQKLNMIIVSLQRDMQGLRQQYEQACENRNLTGIQLIDRNDELCILYEKSNIQENILRTTEMNIKSVEDQIRMIRIQIAQNERKVKVAQQKLIQVPTFAKKVLELQEQIQVVHREENDLSKKLQDPENKQRWRELQGQDPDQQALDAKISIIQQRLNSKKQQLLEKELILDEVSNLVEKLKKDATEGRQSTLEVSQKINQFQSRLRDLTRKMKATISQLSMCQANIIKYQNERQQIDSALQSAKKRMEEGLPPTPQTQIEYLKMIRDKKRYQQQRRIRMQKQLMQQNYPPFATKTTANQRVNSYIPDQIGLPKPYGSNAPFMYQSPGSNMRHFKKPKVKQIQI